MLFVCLCCFDLLLNFDRKKKKEEEEERTNLPLLDLSASPQVKMLAILINVIIIVSNYQNEAHRVGNGSQQDQPSIRFEIYY